MAETAMLLEERSFALQLRQADVLELNRHWIAHVDLQREDALADRLGRLLVGDVDGCDAVDLLDEVIALGGDRVLVPVVLLDRFKDLGGFADGADDVLLARVVDDNLLSALREDAAAVFVVEDAAVL